MGWQWHQLDHMQIICTSQQTDNHASTPPYRNAQNNYKTIHRAPAPFSHSLVTVHKASGRRCWL